ncbi:MAG: acyltransferase [Anaerolineales bacterium]|nr:acyltransferase [Anaerolineales bacterium]
MSENTQKMLALEGIRGIAALVVIFDHLHLAFFVETDQTIASYLNTHFPFLISKAGQYFVTGLHDGNFAVWVFWVMSAFVLSRKYFQLTKANRDLDSAEYLTRSVIKRYPRLFVPIFASVLFAFIILSAGWMTNNDLGERLGTHTSQGWLFTFYEFEPSLTQAIKSAVWDTFFDFNRDTTYNTVLWTMQPEFFGSLFLFGFLSLVGNKTIRWFVYPIIVLILYFKELHWLNAFLLGIVLCDLYENTDVFTKAGSALKAGWLQALFGLGIMVLIGAPNYGGVFHLIIAVVLIFLALSTKGVAGVFSARLPVYLGKISFSLYLIHVPILCSATGFIYRNIESHIGYPVSAITTSAATIVICIFAADIFYKIADQQGINLGRKLSDSLNRTSEKHA